MPLSKYLQKIASGLLLNVLTVFPLLCAGEDSAPVDNARYDWVPNNEQEKSAKKPANEPQSIYACRGSYVDPMATQGPINTSSDLANEPIYIEADSTKMTADNITLEGQVEIRQASRQIKANYMAYDQKTEQAELANDVEIRQRDLLLRGDRAQVNMIGKEARFDGSEFVIHSSHMRGSAKSIEHQSDGKVILEKGRLTTCEPGRESWVLKGSQLSIDPNKHSGVGKNITVEVGGIPILYTPYITFPMGDARQTGLLVPSVGTSEGGLDITIPWYWNIAPNYDATIAPRFAAGHGAMIETELRHLSELFSNQINIALLLNDRGGGDPDVDDLIRQGTDEKLLRPYKGDDRWLLGFEHKGGVNQRWYSHIDYTGVSDVDYFRDLSTESFSVINSTYLSQQAAVGYHLPNWEISAKFQEYQNLLVDVDESYRQLPRVQFNGRYSWNTWALSLDNELTVFDHPNPNFIRGERVNIDYAIEHNKQWLSGFVRSNLGVQSLAYNIDNSNLLPGKIHSPQVSSPYVSIDSGLFFERNDGQQTFEPHLFYLYRQYTDQSDLLSVIPEGLGVPTDINFDTTVLTFSYDQLFRDRRFAGGDRLSDANRLTLAFTSEWLDNDLSRPTASLSLGKVMYFSDRRVSLNSADQQQTIEESDIAGKMMLQVRNNMQFRADFLYNPKTEKLMRTTTGVEFQDNHERRINFNYHFVREDEVEQTTLPVNQLDTAAILPVGHQWQLLGRIFYDLDEHKELDAFVGFEYDDCCYRIRLLARRWLDSKLADLVDDKTLHYDNGLFLEVDLKGLASSGNTIQKLLRQTLPGFRD